MPAGLIQLSGRRYIQATRWNLTTGRGGRDHSSCFIGAAGRATCQLLIMRALRPGVVVPFVTLRDDLLAAYVVWFAWRGWLPADWQSILTGLADLVISLAARPPLVSGRARELALPSRARGRGR